MHEHDLRLVATPIFGGTGCCRSWCCTLLLLTVWDWFQECNLCAERILRLSASVFRTDSVLLHLRDGDKVIARGEDATFSEGVRAAACRAFARPTPGIAVISNPASDPR